MGYARLDDSFWISEKIDGLSDKAFRLYVRSISFASALNTDGVITRRNLRLLEAPPKVATELVAAGAWDVHPEGWEIHNYTLHNASAEERKKRATIAANSRWGNKPKHPPADATSMLGASDSHANSMQPASIEQCGNDAYTDQIRSDQINYKGNSDQISSDQVVPQAATAKREPLNEEQRAKLILDFAALPSVAERIDEALSHAAAKKSKSEYLYLRSWLRRDFEQLPQNRSKPNGTRPHNARELFDADPVIAAHRRRNAEEFGGST